MNLLTEQDVQRIATGVYQTFGSRFGVNQTPTHSHDDVDSPRLSPTSLTNVETLSTLAGAVLNGQTVTNVVSPVAVFPIPILSGVPTGTAPEGTLVMGIDSSVPKLYVRVNGIWIAIFH